VQCWQASSSSNHHTEYISIQQTRIIIQFLSQEYYHLFIYLSLINTWWFIIPVSFMQTATMSTDVKPWPDFSYSIILPNHCCTNLWPVGPHWNQDLTSDSKIPFKLVTIMMESAVPRFSSPSYPHNIHRALHCYYVGSSAKSFGPNSAIPQGLHCNYRGL
jgi:hypothetical protein